MVFIEETEKVKLLIINQILEKKFKDGAYSWDQLIDLCRNNGLKITDDGFIQDALTQLTEKGILSFEHGAIIKINKDNEIKKPMISLDEIIDKIKKWQDDIYTIPEIEFIQEIKDDLEKLHPYIYKLIYGIDKE